MEEPGQKLKKIRERLRLRFRDVEEASARIAAQHSNDEFVVALSRLADIENKGTMPSAYRLYSLCAIYAMDMSEVLSWYGRAVAQQLDSLQHCRSSLGLILAIGGAAERLTNVLLVQSADGLGGHVAVVALDQQIR